MRTNRINTPCFKKQTTTILEFYFRFRLSPLLHHRHVTLHRFTKFHSNQTNGCDVKYWFFKTAATAPQLIPLPVIFLGHPSFREVKVFLQSKCRRDTSIHCWNIPVFNEKRPTLEFYFGFDFHLCIIIVMSFCVCVPNRTIRAVWCHIDYSRCRTRTAILLPVFWWHP